MAVAQTAQAACGACRQRRFAPASPVFEGDDALLGQRRFKERPRAAPSSLAVRRDGRAGAGRREPCRVPTGRAEDAAARQQVGGADCRRHARRQHAGNHQRTVGRSGHCGVGISRSAEFPGVRGHVRTDQFQRAGAPVFPAQRRQRRRPAGESGGQAPPRPQEPRHRPCDAAEAGRGGTTLWRIGESGGSAAGSTGVVAAGGGSLRPGLRAQPCSRAGAGAALPQHGGHRRYRYHGRSAGAARSAGRGSRTRDAAWHRSIHHRQHPGCGGRRLRCHLCAGRRIALSQAGEVAYADRRSGRAGPPALAVGEGQPGTVGELVGAGERGARAVGWGDPSQGSAAGGLRDGRRGRRTRQPALRDVRCRRPSV